MKKLLYVFASLSLSPSLAFACEGACGNSPWTLMDPKGPVAADEKHLIFTALGLMLIVVIPVIIMTFAFAWKYRAGNKNATYAPKWENSHAIELVVWTIPTVIIIMLGTIVWKSTHALTPEKPIASSVKPLVIEAVAMDWKWLFIYPEQGVATVNRLVIPAKTPITFHITSDTVMNSFFIPRLGSQIYAMAGMQTELNLLADKPGTYHGLNTQFSGEGFTSMHFSVHATYPQEFQDWVAQTKSGGNMLDAARFRKLETPDEPAAPILFSAVQPGLFQSILRKFAGGHEMSASSQNPVSLAQAQK